MKTLDEVIKALEICTESHGCVGCPYLMGDYDKKCEQQDMDALHYLKEYRTTQTAYIKAMADIEDNPALSWDELKQMEGKPVWVEEPFSFCDEWHGYWEVISSFCDDEYVDDPDPVVYMTDEEIRHKKDLGKTWQAYRKERTNADAIS